MVLPPPPLPQSFSHSQEYSCKYDGTSLFYLGLIVEARVLSGSENGMMW